MAQLALWDGCVEHLNWFPSRDISVFSDGCEKRWYE